MKHWKERFFTREIMAYIIVGIITTGINIISYDFLCNRLHISNLLANGGAWLFSVIFAFFANDRIVFRNMEGKNSWGMRLTQFLLARGASLLVDEMGMLLLVDVVHVNNLISKAVMNVIIVILNYILSKKIIFR
ncbi:MAG: GtrA family protein [Acetivibrio sp.]